MAKLREGGLAALRELRDADNEESRAQANAEQDLKVLSGQDLLVSLFLVEGGGIHGGRCDRGHTGHATSFFRMTATGIVAWWPFVPQRHMLIDDRVGAEVETCTILGLCCGCCRARTNLRTCWASSRSARRLPEQWLSHVA